MSEYSIDEKGVVTFPRAKNTFIVVSPEDVEKLIANGKFTKDEIAKIKANRIKHAQQVLTINDPTSAHNEDAMEMPGVMGDNESTPAKDDKPLEMPVMDFTPKAKQNETETDSKVSKSKVSKSKSGESPLASPSMTF